LGAFIGAGVVYGVYINLIKEIDPNQTLVSAGFFGTFRDTYLSNGDGFAN